MEFEDLKVEVPSDEKDCSHLVNNQVKKYQNQDSSTFITGFDVTSQEAEERRLKRAKRFGLSTKPNTENMTPIDPLPSCIENLPKESQDAKLRPDAILLFGVNEMSTKDVFDYFQDYVPESIEWIDDISCVIVWEDENSAKRAFVNMGTKFSPLEDTGSDFDGQRLDNIWRIGKKHPKAKQLLMRYATKADKKMKGAGSRSLYYLVHGRAEQEKSKARKRGLISSSRRRKINADRSRIKTELNQSTEVEILDIDLDESMDDSLDEMDVDEPPIKVLISEDMIRDESPRGKLYADQEKNSDIYSRLSKPSADVLQKQRDSMMQNLTNSAKMDGERLGNPGSHSQDLRQKLKNRKQRFDRKT